MTYRVFVVAEAEGDILDICEYVAANDSLDKAQYVFGKLEAAINDLCNLAERGHFPPELKRVGVMEYREVHFKPYRIIYQIVDKKVYVHCVLDGRRDLQELLERRLLR